MQTQSVVVLPGEGIGPEVVASAQRVLEATKIPFRWEVFENFGKEDTIPKEVLEAIQRTKVCLKGPTGTPIGEGRKSLNVSLRQELDLYANVRPIRTMPGVRTRFSDVLIDIIIFRENIEGEYAVSEKRIPGGVEVTCTFTEAECRRIAEFAFNYATFHHRRKVTIGHKANIWKLAHGMFRDVAYEVAKQFPHIGCDDLIADNYFAKVVSSPEKFDCILVTNMVGDFMSDTCAALVGGLGYAAGANIGPNAAVFEAVHGTAPDIIGKGIANPVSMILSAGMMLERLGHIVAAEEVRSAADRALLYSSLVSRDGRVKSTSAFTDFIVSSM